MPRIVRWIGKFVLVVIGAQVGLGQGELISSAGSGRATAYLESTKIITYADKTHVAWLDSDAEGFRVRIRTRDAVSGAWSPVWTIGEAANNHGTGISMLSTTPTTILCATVGRCVPMTPPHGAPSKRLEKTSPIRPWWRWRMGH